MKHGVKLPLLGGISRDYFASELSLYTLLYILSLNFAAYMAVNFLKILLALVSCILLGRDILGKKYRTYEALIVLRGYHLIKKSRPVAEGGMNSRWVVLEYLLFVLAGLAGASIGSERTCSAVSLQEKTGELERKYCGCGAGLKGIGFIVFLSMGISFLMAVLRVRIMGWHMRDIE